MSVSQALSACRRPLALMLTLVMVGSGLGCQVPGAPPAPALAKVAPAASAKLATKASGGSAVAPQATISPILSLPELTGRAQAGDAAAQLRLGLSYAVGHFGLARDETQAVIWMRRSAEQGVALAQFLVGVRYSSGQGVHRDYAQSMQWLGRAADQNLPKAQLLLGTMYALGRGTGVDPTRAAYWYRRAADQADPDAEYLLGEAYAKGEGVKQDYGESIRWYLKAAAQNPSDAQAMSGLAYHQGLGVAQDYRKALFYYLAAAEGGSTTAYLLLGLMYEDGEGVRRDLVVAYALVNLAAANLPQGEEPHTFRDQIGQQLNQKQILAAQGLSERLARPGQFIATLLQVAGTPSAGDYSI